MLLENEKPESAREQQLDALFAAYREACPDPDPSPDFMPLLWQRIDSNRSFRYSLKRLAQGFITAAAAAALIMGISLVAPDSRPSPTYLELLAAGNAHYDLADTEIVQALHENSR